ncbi:hypothetical protein [Shewanella sedimentimangrovi]|uniref:DUF4131 domain-containing protein n=1 Tax=Shewanella sedimentimangrovi TaxID=2814293 RepID=A0ABX7R4S9_9GAMM|nr:hypothetical protein [Shewanella sedimentimangrovi]QSX37820.1 hypothetical protein JYB85_02970 [Shewanella sedimentimangrovi]
MKYMTFFDISQDSLLSVLPVPWPLAVLIILLGFVIYPFFKHHSGHWNAQKIFMAIWMLGTFSMGLAGISSGLLHKYKDREYLITGNYSVVAGSIEQHVMVRRSIGASEFEVDGVQFSLFSQYFSESKNPKYRLRDGLNVRISYIPEENTILKVELEEADFKKMLDGSVLAKTLCTKYQSCVQ